MSDKPEFKKAVYEDNGHELTVLWKIQRDAELAQLRQRATPQMLAEADKVTKAYLADSDDIYADKDNNSRDSRTREALKPAKELFRDDQSHRLFQDLLCHQINSEERNQAIKSPKDPHHYFNYCWDPQKPTITRRRGEIELTYLDLAEGKHPGLVTGSTWRDYDGSRWNNLQVENAKSQIVAWLSNNTRDGIRIPNRVEILNEHRAKEMPANLQVFGRIMTGRAKLDNLAKDSVSPVSKQAISDRMASCEDNQLPSRKLLKVIPQKLNLSAKVKTDLKVYAEPKTEFASNLVLANAKGEGVIRFSYRKPMNDLPIVFAYDTFHNQYDELSKRNQQLREEKAKAKALEFADNEDTKQAKQPTVKMSVSGTFYRPVELKATAYLLPKH